jgi:hypothetical protein
MTYPLICRLLGLEDAEDFVFLHDQEVFAVELDLSAAPLAEEDAIAGLDVEGKYFAFVVGLALADGDHFTLLRLLLRGVGDNDAATDAFALFDAPDQDAIVAE